MAAAHLNGLAGWPSFGGMNRESEDSIAASFHTKPTFRIDEETNNSGE